MVICEYVNIKKNIYILNILQQKMKIKTYVYTLSSDKCNAIIYLVLSVKLKEEIDFRRAPYIHLFSMQIVFF